MRNINVLIINQGLERFHKLLICKNFTFQKQTKMIEIKSTNQAKKCND